MDQSVFVVAVGAALPSRVLSNEELIAGMPWLDTCADWVREHTGVRQRHVASPDEHATDLGVRAAVEALDRAGVNGDEVDMLIMATNTAPFVYPAGAAIIKGRLLELGYRIGAAAAFDVQQGCAGHIAGVILAKSLIESGACRQVLAVGADVSTRMLDWTDRSSVLLGDGATAFLVADRAMSKEPGLQLLGASMQTEPDIGSIHQLSGLDVRNHPLQHIEYGKDLPGRVTKQALYARLGSEGPKLDHRHFFMEGRKVYRFVRRTVPSAGYVDALARAGLFSPEELQEQESLDGTARGQARLRERLAERIDLFVPHGANMALDQELAEQLGIPFERMALTLNDHGNTSSASVGIALHRLLNGEVRYETVVKRDARGEATVPSRTISVRRPRPGDNVLLLSFGAGTSWNYVVARVV